jgi:hypothetical protein
MLETLTTNNGSYRAAQSVSKCNETVAILLAQPSGSRLSYRAAIGDINEMKNGE